MVVLYGVDGYDVAVTSFAKSFTVHAFGTSLFRNAPVPVVYALSRLRS